MKTLQLAIVLIVSILLVTPISSQSQSKSRAGRPVSTTSVIQLINPPNESVLWRFGANQKIGVRVGNSNVLGATFMLTSCDFPDMKISGVLLPGQSTQTHSFYIYGKTPVVWKFELATGSSAAMLGARATWAKFD